MKRLLAILLITASFTLSAQTGVGINTATPEASSALDISSTSKGLLIPRMTEVQRTGINPSESANGLLVYQTDGTSGFYYYNGMKWNRLEGVQGPQGTPGLDGIDGAAGGLNGAAGADGTNGTDGAAGIDGTNGADGASAYQLAVTNGFVGTEAAWLTSLEGVPGADGTNGTDGAAGADGTNGIDGTNGSDGASAYQLAVTNGFTGTEAAWLTAIEGMPGADGVDGIDGAVGPTGATGLTGADGIDGIDGAVGPTGLTGADGIDGSDGVDGINGTDGINGSDGASAYQLAVTNGFAGTEAAWLTAIEGVPGADGIDGIDGIDGAVGPTGATGLTGADGIDGIDGAVGPTGLTGADGIDGSDGVDGINGTDGINGSDGASAYQLAVTNGFAGTEAAWLTAIEGVPGADGIDGIDGAVGPTGPTGLTGADGIDGIDGAVGPTGLTGADGIDSSDGVDGTNGTDGTNGSDGASAYQLAVTNGFAGTEAAWLTSLEGADGIDGTDGAQGIQGEPGADGTTGIPTGGTEGQVLKMVGGIPVWSDPVQFETYYKDTDGDGYGNNDEQLIVLSGSNAPNGYVDNFTDCNDNDATINPLNIWYLDADNDNYAVSITTQCTAPGVGYTQTVLSLGDCNDSDATINPATVWYLDADGDNYAISKTAPQCANPGAGYTATVLPLSDCNDTDVSINPGETEVPYDGIDNDCNTATLDDDLDGDGFVNANDCNDSDATINPATVWYLDADGDNDAVSTTTQCTSPGAGYTTTVLPLSDCNDSDATINPATVWYLDADGDNYAISTKTQCANPGVGYTVTVLPLSDCNDSDVSINPATVWYIDADNDGYGNATTSEIGCLPTLINAIQDNTDCNDSDATMNPATVWYLDADGDNHAVSTSIQCISPGVGYTQTVLFLDDCNDSDATINPATVWYLDADGDNYAISTKTQCANPGAGYTATVLPLSDCNDTDGSINPGSIEDLANGIDDDCDGEIDEINIGDLIQGGIVFWVDPEDSTQGKVCDIQDAPNRLDWDSAIAYCNELVVTRNTVLYDDWYLPSIDELNLIYDNKTAIITIALDNGGDSMPKGTYGYYCSSTEFDNGGYTVIRDFTNGYPSNHGNKAFPFNVRAVRSFCSGSAATVWYLDADGDNYAISKTAPQCANPGAGYTTTILPLSDCNDTDVSINPGVTEVPYDGIDNDCNTATLDDDLDGDGFVNANDCNDNDASVNKTTTFYVDTDMDGFGSTATADLCSATAPTGYATVSGDCNDTNAAVNPGATEVPYDGIDNDCDGEIDEIEIGDLVQGGIVFWVDPTDNLRGKVCYYEDVPTAKNWDAAMAYCNAFQATLNTVLYGDWYLPSIDDLHLMYANKTAINTTALSNGGSSFADYTYWSSSEYDNSGASIQSFTNGNQWHNVNKGDTGRVRAVRAFEPPTVAKVGDYRDGGIVFWVDPADNTKGKVCYTKDAPNTEDWFTAKAHCLGFEVTINTVFYDDWYLPSKEELDLMYRNKTTINATAIANGGNNFNTGSNDRFWWSSTTRTVGQYTLAWQQNFDTGVQNDYYQYPSYNVRAVRAF
jgi:hypothetical protein